MCAATSNLIDSLPGLSMPVADVPRALSRMWDGAPVPESDSPSAFRASQMNLILHFGVATTPNEAREQFDTAIAFGQLYPCRIVVLCPEPEDRGGEEAMTGKLFSQCYIGPSHREMCCCEALILGYGTRDAHLLEDQVSIWLEGDLPVYYRVHRVPADIIKERYLPFLQECRRVVYDSTVDGGALESLAETRLGLFRDLAWARILPLRQSLGSFLSGFPPEALVSGLRAFRVRASKGRWSEAQNLLCWMWGGIRDCRSAAGIASDFPACDLEAAPEERDADIEVVWSYDDKNTYFNWRHSADSRISVVSAAFDGPAIEMPVPIRVLTPPEALAEAFFF